MSWKRPHIDKRMMELLNPLPSDVGGYWLDTGSGRQSVFAELLDTNFDVSVVQMDKIRIPSLFGTTYTGYISSPSLRATSLNGVVAAQVLHYLPSSRLKILFRELTNYVIKGGYFVIIEYQTDRSYSWLPYPLSRDKIDQWKGDGWTSFRYFTDSDQRRPKFSYILQRV